MLFLCFHDFTAHADCPALAVAPPDTYHTLEPHSFTAVTLQCVFRALWHSAVAVCVVVCVPYFQEMNVVLVKREQNFVSFLQQESWMSWLAPQLAHVPAAEDVSALVWLRPAAFGLARMLCPSAVVILQPVVESSPADSCAFAGPK